MSLFVIAALLSALLVVARSDKLATFEPLGSSSPFIFHDRECEMSLDGAQLFFCPSRGPGVDASSRKWPCIRAVELCDGIPDCPRAEDEDPTLCLFHKAEQQEIRALKRFLFRKQLAAPDAVIPARGRHKHKKEKQRL